MKHLVVAPHPDDETLGCGGTLLRRASDGHSLHWLITTRMTPGAGYDDSAIRDRERVIEEVEEAYGFAGVHRLGFPTTALDTVPRRELVEKIGDVFREVRPGLVYLPHPGDAHSDHKTVFGAAAACTKWFRSGSVRRILAYETLSETDQGLASWGGGFEPNVFVDVSDFLDRKVEIMNLYQSEVGDHPFPRSEGAIRALAKWRGATGGFEAAEAFLLLRERL